MSRDCYRIEELGEIADLPDDDPRRAHLAGCAHCQALLASVLAFKNPSVVPKGAQPQVAAAKLQQILDQKLGLGDLPAGGEGELPRRRSAPGPFHLFLSRLWRPGFRPAWGLAAICVVAVGFLMIYHHLGEISGPIVTREAATDRVAALSLHPPRALSEDQFLLSWEPVEGADGYEVLLLDADLNVQLRLPVGSDPAASVEGARLSETFGREPILWQVRALQRGEELQHSTPERLRIP
ncbi:MAG: hypothetical protein KJ970_00170 [Candidatus Eisenbacteria bacterium]|uniref:Uncharacterized protein n=1 Tax=Eiseniibacteriota bacterium TaxID=2212470 RepID=A0A948RW19_UNCEI|nr:hypothetical protein [Candidatus Eisenbacteria bacterium]MBU1948498.1 hypothetical protein [Candidatus Eisenbacteria bacterium]MBU2689314.1 hypothetical protein [Candidatus Eisenbacteria bacterium]